MKIEHIGISVLEPVSMADWYVKHLGFTIRRSAGTDQNGVVFLGDPTQETMLEIFNNNKTPPLDSRSLSPLTLHFAFKSSDPQADARRLEKAGATIVEWNEKKPGADELILLRDPWGNVIQMAKRAKEF